MERMEEYQRMRKRRPAGPSRRSWPAWRPGSGPGRRQREEEKRPVLAAVCLCLVLGTGMAWGMGGFAALDRLLGKTRDS